jgi:hypothetical protein
VYTIVTFRRIFLVCFSTAFFFSVALKQQLQSLGIFHVLTGPDHLSAIATLSANVANVTMAFWLGIRWGIGHSTGLLCVGSIFILLSIEDDKDNGGTNTNTDDTTSTTETITVPDHVSHLFESLVGVFMLVLGIYGLHNAWWKKKHAYTYMGTTDHTTTSFPRMYNHHNHYDHNHSSDNDENEREDMESPFEDEIDMAVTTTTTTTDATAGVEEEMECVQYFLNGLSMPRHYHHHHHNYPHPSHVHSTVHHVPVPASTSTDDDDNHIDVTVPPCLPVTENTISSLPPPTPTQRPRQQSTMCKTRCFQTLSVRTMAMTAGIVHGLAGPGGVLGVIPAVQLHNAQLATIYLVCFCTTSTITMGIFAMIYGTCSSKFVVPSPRGSSPTATTNAVVYRGFVIESISASLSILVGILWLTLLSIGKLDDVFP